MFVLACCSYAEILAAVGQNTLTKYDCQEPYGVGLLSSEAPSFLLVLQLLFCLFKMILLSDNLTAE